MDSRIEAALKVAQDCGEEGVQVAAYLDGELIVDAWTGDTKPDGPPIDGDTMFCLFSVTKAVSFTAIHVLAERGLLEYDAPIARYWPEYGVNGKDRVLIQHLLEHRTGAPQMPPDTTMEHMLDWDWVIENLAQIPLLFPPGEKSTYQAYNMGWIIGEVVQRVDPQHRHLRQWVLDELCEPLGIDDIWIGIRPEDNHRVADLCGDYEMHSPMAARPLWPLVAPKPIEPEPTRWNAPEVRQASLPATGAISTARSIGKLFAMLANRGELGGTRLLSEGRVWSFTRDRPNPLETDAAIGGTPRQGVGGYRRSIGEYPSGDASMGDRPWALMQNGAGGTIAWADLENKISVAICHNRMFDVFPLIPYEEHPFRDIGDAVYDIAGLSR
jgi:CubicO group peptidase (beta-lactamase class C family)